MGKWLSTFGVVALLLVSQPVRADVVVLTDGREITGDAAFVGQDVVVSGKHGEARFARDLVAKIKTDAEVRREEQARPAPAPRYDVPERLLDDLFGKPPPELPAAEAIAWEKDAKVAEKLAAESKKIVLTFVVVGDLGTGHC
jgi:hypothetical protein